MRPVFFSKKGNGGNGMIYGCMVYDGICVSVYIEYELHDMKSQIFFTNYMSVFSI